MIRALARRQRRRRVISGFGGQMLVASIAPAVVAGMLAERLTGRVA
jgi:hypothetical protein